MWLSMLMACGDPPAEQPARTGPPVERLARAPAIVWVRHGLDLPGWQSALTIQPGKVGLQSIDSVEWLDLDTGASLGSQPHARLDAAMSSVSWHGEPVVRLEVEHGVIDEIVNLPDGTVVALDRDATPANTWRIAGTIQISGAPVGVQTPLDLKIGEVAVRTSAEGAFDATVPAGRPLAIEVQPPSWARRRCLLERSVAFGDEEAAWVYRCDVHPH